MNNSVGWRGLLLVAIVIVCLCGCTLALTTVGVEYLGMFLWDAYHIAALLAYIGTGVLINLITLYNCAFWPCGRSGAAWVILSSIAYGIGWPVLLGIALLSDVFTHHERSNNHEFTHRF